MLMKKYQNISNSRENFCMSKHLVQNPVFPENLLSILNSRGQKRTCLNYNWGQEFIGIRSFPLFSLSSIPTLELLLNSILQATFHREHCNKTQTYTIPCAVVSASVVQQVNLSTQPTKNTAFEGQLWSFKTRMFRNRMLWPEHCFLVCSKFELYYQSLL